MNMESFNAPQSEEEKPMTREEIIQEIARLEKMSVEAKENIDVEPGSKDYVDFGYMEAAQELEARLALLDGEEELKRNVDAAQGKLDI